MFLRYKGKTILRWFPKKASTAFTAGELVTADGSGNVKPATSTSTSIVGVCRSTVASTDTTNDLIAIEVPVEPTVEWNALTSGATASNVGLAYDLTDANTVNLGATAVKIVTVVGVISATQVRVVINGMFDTVPAV